MALRRRYDKRFTLASFLVTVAFMVPSTYVHELGHGAICKMEGLDFEYSVGLQGGVLDCPGIVEPHLWFYFMGGGTAALVFFGIGVLGGRVYKPIQVAGFAIAASNFMVAMIETFAHSWYMSGSSTVSLGINLVAFMIWFTFVIFYHPRKAMEQAKTNEERGQRTISMKRKVLAFVVIGGALLWLGAFGIVSLATGLAVLEGQSIGFITGYLFAMLSPLTAGFYVIWKADKMHRAKISTSIA